MYKIIISLYNLIIRIKNIAFFLFFSQKNIAFKAHAYYHERVMVRNIILPALLGVLLCGTVFATDYSTDASGPWSTAGTWSPSGPPGMMDQATISDGHHVIITNDDAVCSNWFVNFGGSCTIDTGGIITNNHESRFFGAVTQNAGTVYAPNIGYKPYQLFHNMDAGGYTLNGGDMILGYGIKVGGSKAYGHTNGLLTINGGMANFNTITLGYWGHGRMIMTDGVVTNFGTLVLGMDDDDDGEGLGEFIFSGGEYMHVGTPYEGIQVGSGTGANSTGIVTQSGGFITTTHHKPHIIVGHTTAGKYYLTGGVICWRNNLILGYNSTAHGLLSICGGHIDLTEDDFFTLNGTGVLEIVGSGCTNINVTGFVDFNSNTTVRALVDNNGITMITAGEYVALTNTTLEIGPTNGYSAGAATYEFIRTPEANEIITNGMTIVSLDADYPFTAYVTNYSSYDWLILECTQAPFNASLFKFQ